MSIQINRKRYNAWKSTKTQIILAILQVCHIIKLWYLVKPKLETNRNGAKMKFNQIIAPSMKELFIKEIEALICRGSWKWAKNCPPSANLQTRWKSAVQSSIWDCPSWKQRFYRHRAEKRRVCCRLCKNGKLDTLISIINFNGGRFDKKPSIP